LPHPSILSRRSQSFRAQFAATPFLGLQFGIRTPGFGELALNKVGLRPNVVMRLPSTDAVKRLVEAGLRIGLMGRIAAEREIATGRLTALTVESFAFQRSLLLFRPAGRLRSPAAASFHRFLRQHPRIRTAVPDALVAPRASPGPGMNGNSHSITHQQRLFPGCARS
jgi:DNA-binding transcriptional LysR family regulator